MYKIKQFWFYKHVYSIKTILYKMHFDFLTKFNFFNLNLKFNIKKVIITISINNGLKNETDLKIINSLNILDFLFFKKSEIKLLLNRYIKKSRTFIFISKVTLNDWLQIYNLIFCLQKILIPNLNKKYIKFKTQIQKNNFTIYIEDVSSLAEMPNELKKDKIAIKLSFFFNNNFDNKKIKFFFKYFGIF